ncbi:sialomucin core protein 24 [Plakobranchus ocellatus]|uniref:Sialomucin core protein 24 n=1 Tax=Plakobranchus ocellatus TaxID=259542 RepID=A0AAV3ZCZ2_9GAST|nr:sialomucin core protein 24 [Plakobranchus ocellatus]
MCAHFSSGKPYSWFCIVIIALFVVLTFPAVSSQDVAVGGGDNGTSCANLTEENCCNDTDAFQCSLCQNGDTKTCKESCDQNEKDTCAAPPTLEPMTCGNLTADTCCNSTDALNCSLCQAQGADGICKAECSDGETDTCAAPPTLEPMTCGNLTADTCCNSTDALNCSLCQAPGADGICKADCAAGETDTCIVEPTTVTTPTTTNGSTTTPTTTTAGGGGSSGQSFDGASFVGGIILSLGIVAIVFFGLKFYKARKDQNYHTL